MVVPTRFKADFDHFGHRPIRTDMADTAQFWPNQPSSARIGANRAKSVRIREKKNYTPHRCVGNRVRCHVPRRAASDSGAAPSQLRLCFPDNQPLSEVEKLEKASLCAGLEKTALLEEISWRQKSRVLYLKEGDSNIRFFHRMANSNRRNNSIENLMIDGALTSNQDRIANHIEQFYMNLYSKHQEQRPFPDALDFLRISGDNVDWLERPFKETEIYEVIKEFNGDKSPGLNGFPMAFFQACWGILKSDIMAVFHLFHVTGQFEKSLNATFITLIPKKAAAVDVMDFRPISLVGGVYKILAQVLAIRLCMVLGDIILAT